MAGVLSVSQPAGTHAFTDWITLLEFPSAFTLDVILPYACFGSYGRRLVVASTWPIGLLGFAFATCVGIELLQSPLKRELLRPRFDRLREALRAGLRRVIPIFLWVTFLLVPSTATIIFVILLVLNLRLPDRLIPCSRLLLAPRCHQKTFLCVPVQYDRTSIRRYLYNDLAIQCDTDEYFATRGTALIMLVIWPVGVPVLYALLLWAVRKSVVSHIPSPLSRGTLFLVGDYDSSKFWWEPLEMIRKLVLTGGVLLIGEDQEQARTLLALLWGIRSCRLGRRSFACASHLGICAQSLTGGWP